MPLSVSHSSVGSSSLTTRAQRSSHNAWQLSVLECSTCAHSLSLSLFCLSVTPSHFYLIFLVPAMGERYLASTLHVSTEHKMKSAHLSVAFISKAEAVCVCLCVWEGVEDESERERECEKKSWWERVRKDTCIFHQLQIEKLLPACFISILIPAQAWWSVSPTVHTAARLSQTSFSLSLSLALLPAPLRRRDRKMALRRKTAERQREREAGRRKK